MGLAWKAIRSLLFQLDPERAHTLAIDALEAAGRRRWARRLVRWWFRHEDLSLSTRVMGIDFANPIGVAAGFDKDARVPHSLAALGFGHVEVGSVLARPWNGNPRPRVFRLPRDEAVVNRMGLPSGGATRAARNLARVYPGVPVGVNLARAGPLPADEPDRALEELCSVAQVMAPLSSYLTLNASCPNTADGATLEDPARMAEAIRALLEAIASPAPPLLVKLSPDLDERTAVALASEACAAGAAGILAGNTTRGREGLQTSDAEIAAIGRGGLSGAPQLGATRARVRALRQALGPAPVLIACGGIATGRDVYSMIRHGADLCQLYTAMVFHGPGTPGRICRELAECLRRDGARSVESIRGADL